jgi:hypothetical protein
LSKGLNFAVAPKQVSNLDSATVVEEIAQRLPPVDNEEYRWKVLYNTLETRTIKTNMPQAELRAISQ